MFQLNLGTVKSFDPNPLKQYGFLETDLSDVFFHYNDAAKIVFDGTGTPSFSDQREKLTPRRGDQIVFTRDMNRKGVIAKPWTFYHLYLKAMRECGNRFLPSEEVVLRYPFLSELAIRAKRPTENGKFTIEEEPLTSGTLNYNGVVNPDSMIRTRVQWFAVINDPKLIWRIHSFKSKAPVGWDESGSRSGQLVDVPLNSQQLSVLGPEWQSPLAIVMVDTSGSYTGGGSDGWTYKRTIRVYR